MFTHVRLHSSYKYFWGSTFFPCVAFARMRNRCLKVIRNSLEMFVKSLQFESQPGTQHLTVLLGDFA